MKETVSDLRRVISEYAAKFNAIPESELAAKPSLTKWSKKEVIGHLIDSAQNNLRRFIVAQYESVPSQIVYEQDAWVASNHYQDAPKGDVIALWRLLNERIRACCLRPYSYRPSVSGDRFGPVSVDRSVRANGTTRDHRISSGASTPSKRSPEASTPATPCINARRANVIMGSSRIMKRK